MVGGEAGKKASTTAKRRSKVDRMAEYIVRLVTWWLDAPVIICMGSK